MKKIILSITFLAFTILNGSETATLNIQLTIPSSVDVSFSEDSVEDKSSIQVTQENIFTEVQEKKLYINLNGKGEVTVTSHFDNDNGIPYLINGKGKKIYMIYKLSDGLGSANALIDIYNPLNINIDESTKKGILAFSSIGENNKNSQLDEGIYTGTITFTISVA